MLLGKPVPPFLRSQYLLICASWLPKVDIFTTASRSVGVSRVLGGKQVIPIAMAPRQQPAAVVLLQQAEEWVGMPAL